MTNTIERAGSDLKWKELKVSNLPAVANPIVGCVGENKIAICGGMTHLDSVYSKNMFILDCANGSIEPVNYLPSDDHPLYPKVGFSAIGNAV